MTPDRTREAGYSLTETLVATALLLSVLLPLGAILGRAALVDPVAVRSQALAEAVAAMEETLGAAASQQSDWLLEIRSPKTWPSRRNRWRIERTVERRRGVMAIDILVYRKATDRPLVHLSTLVAMP